MSQTPVSVATDLLHPTMALADWAAVLTRAAVAHTERFGRDAAQRQTKQLEAWVRASTQMLPLPRPADVIEYGIDFVQRQALFWDTIRVRGDRWLDHEAAGKPPLLAFAYDLVLDGRTLPHPVNYALVRIVPPAGMSVDEARRPYVIVDPRAGHGAGVGGFKSDSQVGMALRAGHPVYFVVFSADPVEGQTLRDVAAAEAVFLREVTRRHRQSPKPCVIGNCQAGWAVMALAAVEPELAGPIVINGAPLSYWAGVDGKNPMRYSGGLLGGTWLAQLVSDLGAGQFDGAWLVQNFANLNPGHNFWAKYYDLYATVDTGVQRFLGFERWWGAYSILNGAEIRGIVENLFVGNRLAAGTITTEDGRRIDLRNIRSPILVFCSEGDNITPPQQALNWIVDVYREDRAIKAYGHTIVYLRHLSVGHLGIFVSGGVARKEYKEIVATLDAIEMLPPGLYEMNVHEAGHGADGVPVYDVTLAERSIADIVALDTDSREEERYFRVVSEFSALSAHAYDVLASPLVRAGATGSGAELARLLHPLRVEQYGLSSANPWLAALAPWADWARAWRRPRRSDNPLAAFERAWADALTAWFDTGRDLRDGAAELSFRALYGWLDALGLPGRTWNAPAEDANTKQIETLDAQVERFVEEHIASGGPAAALVRLLLMYTQARGEFGREAIERIVEGVRALPLATALGPAQRRRLVHEQSMIVAYAPERALATLPDLLPTAADREAMAATLGGLLGAEPAPAPVLALVHEVRAVLGLPSAGSSTDLPVVPAA